VEQSGVVAAGHPVTAEVAAEVLRAGGNAVDAVVAGFFAAIVAEPVLAGLAGGGFLITSGPEGRARLYDAFVNTPKRRRPVEELDFRPIVADFGTAQQEFHIGLGAVATPGIVKGIFEAHRREGSLPMRELVAPAAAHARAGVRLNSLQAYIFSVVAPIYLATDSARAIFASPSDPGCLVGEGESLRQPDLAGLLEALALEGDDLFYRGEVAQAITRHCEEGGGQIGLEDLTAYRVEMRAPLTVDYGGARLLTNPPPSSGGILIAFALNLLSAMPPGRHAFGSYGYLRQLARVMEYTNRARVAAVAEGGDYHLDAARLLDPDLLARYRDQVLGRPPAPRGTTHISAMDGRGNMAALSVSSGEGCGTIVPGTGLMLNNMLGEEDLNPGGFHRWPTDVRLTSMMAPTLVLRPRGARIVIGSGGSNRIRTAILQVLVNLLDFGVDVEEAVSRPRVHFENDLLSIEGGFNAGEVARLIESYPNHHLWDDRNLFFGGTHTVVRESGGALSGFGDPRRGGVCLPV
jgi:gamma-glutamyltranspeptidase/glutathione hydrolase